MKSDLELFLNYDREFCSSAYFNKGYNTLEIVRNALSNDTMEVLDIPSLRNIIEEIMCYLPLKKRYLILKSELGDKLKLSKDGFALYEKTFVSIDELEKAVKMKAFL